MTKERPSAILFDMDGVLVRSVDAWAAVVYDAGITFRGRPVSRAEFLPTFGQGTSSDVISFELNCTTDQLDGFYTAEFEKHLDAVWVDPSARSLLSQLREWSIGVALVTNTVGPLAHSIMRHAQLDDFFSVRATPDRVAHPKPAPDMLLLACAELHVSPAEVWMVGDSRFDREAALAARIHFVGLEIDGDMRIDQLSELQSLVKRA